jgi:hypothetical protein
LTNSIAKHIAGIDRYNFRIEKQIPMQTILLKIKESKQKNENNQDEPGDEEIS